MDLVLRPAVTTDARAIAEVHVRSWQWAYRHLLPDKYLDGLSVDQSEARWMERLAIAVDLGSLLVAEVLERLVAFVATSPSRDGDAGPNVGEVEAIYLLEEFAGRGIGRSLMEAALGHLRTWGYEEATLWVLSSNDRARQFYQRGGWVFDGHEKLEEGLGVTFHEVRYRVRLP